MALQISTLRALFARSGNRCAFPHCNQHLIDTDNLFVGQICHIEAASAGGPRYRASQPDEERDSAANLLLLCYPHHRRVDANPNQYAVAWLRSIKEQHELACQSVPFEVELRVAATILAETQEYWRRLHLIQKVEEEKFDLAMGVNPDASFTEVLSDLQGLFDNIDLLFSHAANNGDASKGGATAWEVQNIFLPNALQLSRLYLKQLEVHFLSCQLQLRPADDVVRTKYEAAKAQLVYLVTHSGYAD